MLLVILYFGYYFIFEAAAGVTIGKLITKTKVVNNDNKPPNIFAVLIRTLVRLLGIIDIIVYAFSDKSLHDELSRTRVVKTAGND